MDIDPYQRDHDAAQQGEGVLLHDVNDCAELARVTTVVSMVHRLFRAIFTGWPPLSPLSRGCAFTVRDFLLQFHRSFLAVHAGHL